jgi:haloacetate dehalogenase
MALDHPDRVTKLAVLDIVPAADAFNDVDLEFALSYWHWLFLAQPAPLPERIIAAAPDAFFYRQRNASWLHPEALADYIRCTNNPETIHAMCEDYRAGVTCDLELDRADRGNVRIKCPVLALWGKRGNLEKRHDVLETWRAWGDDVTGQGLDCGHSLPEESPDETTEALQTFLRD